MRTRAQHVASTPTMDSIVKNQGGTDSRFRGVHSSRDFAVEDVTVTLRLEAGGCAILPALPPPSWPAEEEET